ncbi:hypothetical protein [Bosea sp. PAMC 26642]|uniref:hypothetical protein n=1 Tax=Bosea sp. (strain PAMC 26642) TaxID=1792307 RepID=UPI0007701C10|nr:hypothetical protein [Bosea sp. PAMC 26642]AMJ60530.1 hypothetical protein AXW83_09720 [Bosea sp. PAMC 26642]
MDRFIPDAALARIRPAFIGLTVSLACSAASAEGSTEAGYRALWPLPSAPLESAEAASQGMATDELAALIEAGPEGDADAALFAPLRMPLPVQASRTGTPDISRPLSLGVIRKGLSAQGPATLAPSERAVGVKLGTDDVFAVTTRLVTPADGASSDARIDWRLARPVAPHQPGFIWTVATGGGSGLASRPEQNAGLMLGYRQPVFAHLTLTSQLTMQGNYVFAPGDGAHSAVVPEVKLSADLTALAKLPFDTSFDLGLARQMPVFASQYETRGSAMLRVKYTLN